MSVEPLTPADFRTRTWDNFAAFLRGRLARLREENDSGDMDSTARRRGRIAEIKELLSLGDQALHSEDAR